MRKQSRVDRKLRLEKSRGGVTLGLAAALVTLSLSALSSLLNLFFHRLSPSNTILLDLPNIQSYFIPSLPRPYKAS